MCILIIQKNQDSHTNVLYIFLNINILILPKKLLIKKYKITSLDEFSTYMFAIMSCNISFTHFIRQRI